MFGDVHISLTAVRSSTTLALETPVGATLAQRLLRFLGRFAGSVRHNDHRLGPDRGSRAQAVRLTLLTNTATSAIKDGTTGGEVRWVV